MAEWAPFEANEHVIGASLRIIDVAAMLAREVEWLYSGDHSEESFQRLVDEILAGQNPQITC